ncbi:MAG: glycogen synthase, partial [Clostridia bacterium]|nr:glycogen synthase [Clostridia bacterium]
MKICYLSAEVEPFAKSGGLGDVMGALPKAVAKLGHEVAVVMPYYKDVIAEKFQSQMQYLGYYYSDVAWRHQYVGVFTMKVNGVDVYFLDNEFYFKGPMYCFADNERFAYFAKASLDLLGWLGFQADVVHCNDWSTGLVPVLYDAFYKHNDFYRDMKFVYTVHNLKYQGWASKGELQDLTGLDDYYFTDDRLMHNGSANMMKGALVFSHAITTVSPTYAQEITTPEYGCGLEGVINTHIGKLHGVLNGVDYKAYNPYYDKLIAKKYGKKSAEEGKLANKLALQEQLGLPIREDVPMLALISRLVDQKGLDLVLDQIHYILQRDVQFVLLGTGDYEAPFRRIGEEYPTKVSANLTFNNKLAHQIYAAADFVLVPSLFEPCGLTQIIGLKYGAVPIVRETGGLKDTVFSYN